MRLPLFALGALLASCGRAEEPPFAGLALEITPDPARGDVGVLVRVSADRAGLVTELAVARSWADTRGEDAVVDVALRDGTGELPFTPRLGGDGPDRVLVLSRAVVGPLSIRYRARAGASRFAVRVGPDRMSAVGHAFLLLPRVEGAIPARVRFNVAPLGKGAEAASSFGFGASVTTTATMEELGHAIYVAGRLWLERPETAAPARERDKSLVVLGDPPFDGRTAWTFAIGAMAATDRLFGRDPVAPAEPFTFLLVPEPGLGRAHDGAYLTRSLGLWFDSTRGLDPELRLTVAHELTHRYLGGVVRLVEDDGRDAVWFSEGFTVHFARKALLDAHLARPAELTADVRRTLGEPAPGEEKVPYEYRRGAQLAALLDLALRRESGGKRALEAAMIDLMKRARSEGKNRLPVEALREALGPVVAADFDRLSRLRDDPLEMPDGAFGPCFERRSTTSRGFDLGFDPDSLARSPGWIHGLVKGSAAERAGLGEGAMVLSSRVPSPEDAVHRRAEVELVISVGGKQKKVRYRPLGKRTVVRWEAGSCPGR